MNVTPITTIRPTGGREKRIAALAAARARQARYVEQRNVLNAVDTTAEVAIHRAGCTAQECMVCAVD